jgi:hypothetical protein
MKKILLILITGLLLVFIACEKDEIQEMVLDDFQTEKISYVDQTNHGDIVGEYTPTPFVAPEIQKPAHMRTDPVSELTPPEFTATLERGDIVTDPVLGKLWLPTKADIIFHFDISGSMAQEITAVRTHASNIIGNIKAGGIPDLWFGITAGCDYSNDYDMHCTLVDDLEVFNTNMSNVQIVGGGCEQYGLQFNEIANDPAIGWRNTGEQKIAVIFLDEPITAGDYCSHTDYKTVDQGFAALQSNGIIPIVIYSGYSSDFTPWLTKTTDVDGYAFQIGSQGNIPGGMDISEWIILKIQEVLANINLVKLEVNSNYSDFAGWLTGCIPEDYENQQIPTDATKDLPFTMQFTVPDDAVYGMNEFRIDLLGDGAYFGHQMVYIDVLEPDTDGDECLDDVDPHPESIIGGMVTIDGCSTGVQNIFVTDCSTMMDFLLDCAEDAINHGDYVSCVAHLTNEWKSLGLISGKQKGKIQRCAAKADIP